MHKLQSVYLSQSQRHRSSQCSVTLGFYTVTEINKLVFIIYRYFIIIYIISCFTVLTKMSSLFQETPPLDVESVTQTLKEKNILPSTLKFGFLGLGIMGSGIVKNLINSGHSVIIWNRTPDKVSLSQCLLDCISDDKVVDVCLLSSCQSAVKLMILDK